MLIKSNNLGNEKKNLNIIARINLKKINKYI